MIKVKETICLVKNRPVTPWTGRTALKVAWMTVAILLSISGLAVAQILPINEIMEEQIRLQQLMQGSKYSSFTNRPVWMSIYDDYMNEAESGLQSGFWTRPLNQKRYELGSTIQAGVYQPVIKITSNSDVPYGENNEAAWYGRGLNSEFTAGIWVTSDYVTATFRPQFSIHENRAFETPRFIPQDPLGQQRYIAEGIGDIIDMPYRFGPNSFNTANPGYTSIRLHYDAFEAGYSNEPLQWGPNAKYPLLLSNNAPGMKHFFLGTRRPFAIPYIGSVELKWINAFPEDSDYFDQPESYQRERYMGGINLVYSPSFIRNLHLGFGRIVHTYLEEDGLSRREMGMLFDPFYLNNFVRKRGNLRDVKPRYHLNSLFGRWVWPESRIEIFAEYYREDFAWDSRDLLMEPRHNSGYALGVIKLVEAPLADFYKLHVEFTNMTPGFIQEVRPQNYYYTNEEIRQGHTNRGHLLGAAIGPGSNSQYISIDGYFPSGRAGIFFRRLADNNHFHYNYDRFLNRPEEFRNGYGDYWRNRIDLTLGGRGLIKLYDFLLTAELSWTKLFNYGRFDYGKFGGLNVTNFEPYDKTNLQFQLSVTYLF